MNVFTFEDRLESVPLHETKDWFFIPEVLKADVMQKLQSANITYKSVNWRDIPKEKQPQVTAANEYYTKLGFCDAMPCMGALITNADVTYLYDCMKDYITYNCNGADTATECMPQNTWIPEGCIPVRR